MRRVVHQLVVIPKIHLLRHMKREICEEQKFNFEGIDFLAGDTAHLGIVEVVEVLIIEKFRREHDSRDEDTVDIEGG